ncbi:MAG TPA: hypothetical protein VE054_03190 [Blattabacteriaceae bacterium]|nr:hypothetical protein [Blattabacteriaceae bacterium]
MKTHISKLTLLALCLAMLMVVPCAFAQDAAAAEQKDASTSDSVPQPWYANSDGAYSVSLGTGQLISLYPPARNDQTIPNGEYVEGQQSVSLKSNDYKYQMFYGVSASSVYTNSIGGVGTGSDLVSTSINPYLALFIPTQTGRYLLQYSAVVNPNDTQNGGPQAYHTATLSAMGSISPRLYWSASASGSYGSESARLQGPLSFLVVQSTPIADTTSTAVLLQAKNVSFTESTIGLGWLKSRRDKISFSISHVYTGIEGDPTTPQSVGSHANSIGEKLEYVRTLTPRIDLRSYGESDTILNGPTCNTFGGGLGIGVRMTHSVSFDVQGGPQWTTATCGSPVSANFSASIVKNFGNQDKIYASVNRQFTTIAGLDSRWEDNAAVGFAKGIRRVTLTTDAGYLRGDAITTVVPAYHGYFVAPRVRYKLMNTMGLSAGYRSFHGSGGNLVSGNLSYAVVGIEWYPAPLHFR